MLSQLLTDNYANFKRSKEPAQIMYYANGSWVNLAQPDVMETLKSGFLTGTAIVEVAMTIDDEEEMDRKYLFDFIRMLQVDLFTGAQRSIAWIDVDGNCFVPKRFMDDSRNDGNLTMKLEIEVKLNDKALDFSSESCGNYEESDQKMKNRISENMILKLNLGKKKKNVVVHIEGSRGKLERDEGFMSSDNGSNTKRKLRPEKSWNKMEEGYESSTNDGGRKRRCTIVSDNRMASKWPKTTLISEGSAAYELVKKFFLSGVRTVDPTATITSIYKCVFKEGAMEKARLAVFNKQMEIVKGLRGASNTVFAWYGTSAKEVETIVSHGFSMPTDAGKTEAYGVGVYLTPVSLPQLSAAKLQADDNVEKHVILCRVILGNVEKLEAGSRQSHSSGENFDTGADDLKNPKRYVVWCSNMNSHILPDCVVSYKSSDHLSGHPRRPEFAKWLPRAPNSALTNLFSRLERSLPFELGQNLRTLCSAYKAGQLRKDNFIKQLRATVGDKLLRSTITQMRCSK